MADTVNIDLSEIKIPTKQTTKEKHVFGATFKEDPSKYGVRGETTVGYPEGRKDVPAEYMITIKSTAMKRTVRALLQDPFLTSVRSDWRNPSFGTAIKDITQEGMQMASGVTVGSQFMTRRVWYSSSPMSLQLKLKFEAINNAYEEVVLPCGTLQQMTLPSKLAEQTKEGAVNILSYILIVPPGPNPYNGALREWAGVHVSEWLKTRPGDIITIDIGSFISFSSVIVRQADIIWGKKYTREGFPISASAIINFETFEMYTKEDVYNEFMRNRYQERIEADMKAREKADMEAREAYSRDFNKAADYAQNEWLCNDMVI